MCAGRVFLVRVDHDVDFNQYIGDFAKNQKISTAAFTAIGALKSAKLGFYDQKTHTYVEDALMESCELASCTGNISLKDGAPFVHAHAVLNTRNGNTKAGHLMAGKVFAAEIHMFELLGEKIERKLDSVTDLSLWDI
jgi:predicted DNA-binding protein with PD1-like motif